MKRPMFEAEKNYITCGIMMLFVGAGLLAMSKVNLGVICMVIGVGFIVAAIYMYKTNDNRPPEKQKKESKTAGTKVKSVAAENNPDTKNK